MGRRALIAAALALGAAASLGVFLDAAGCSTRRSRRAAADAGAAAPSPPPVVDSDLPRPTVPCPIADKRDLDGALDEAARRFDGDRLTALACVELAARIAPRSVEAHHLRAETLVALERFDEARLAYALALALDPEDPETLASAADFYINRLTLKDTHELLSIGLEYARRGSAHVGRRREDRELASRLALLEAEALDDLGRADEALPRVEAALRYTPDSGEARYQRALVFFHLCKFERARQELSEFVAAHPDDGFAHHHLGLILEREGKTAEAELHFVRARALAGVKLFPQPTLLGETEFAALVEATVQTLDPATRLLLGQVHLELADLPALEDLLANDPPFPPTILGLYREAEAGEARSIVLYRKNLARAAPTRAELERQVRITLLHEIGHMGGADEDELRSRGIE